MRNEKAIKKHTKNLLMWLDSAEENILKLQKESNDRKKAKLEKKINGDKEMVVFVAKDLGKAGGSLNEVLPDLNDIKKQIVYELFNQGTDSAGIKNQDKRNKIINHHKKRLNKLKEAYQEYPMYDESLPVEEKLKNKLYKYEKEVGFFIYTESNKERSIYEPVWNYLEHIDETHEFTEEEKRILQHCYKIGEEYDKYRYNRIDTKLNAIGNFVGDIGYKRFAQGLSNKLFPKYIWMIYPNQNFNDIELKQLGKIMTAKYITFAADKEELKNILRRRLEIINEIRGTNKENEIIDIYAKTTEDEDT